MSERNNFKFTESSNVLESCIVCKLIFRCTSFTVLLGLCCFPIYKRIFDQNTYSGNNEKRQKNENI